LTVVEVDAIQAAKWMPDFCRQPPIEIIVDFHSLSNT